MSADIRLNLFPATIVGPLTNLRSVKVFATVDHLWIISWGQANEPQVANHFPIVSITSARRGERSYLITDDQGQEWMVAKGGGCGCSHPGKGFNVPSYLASIGVTL